MNKKVIIGLSGGVDSSVAAWLLKREGYEVIAATMQTWEDGNKDVRENSVIEDARRVADALGIPHHILHFEKEFKCHVMDYFAQEYLSGRTPNPCIVCNRYVKWEAMLNAAARLGADYIATGHYAKIIQLDNGRYAIQNAATRAKDQTYALYGLTQDQLAHTIMPVGNYEKDQIRQMAFDAGIPVAQKPDSQEICFIPDNDYGNFIRNYQADDIPEGNFVDTSGNVLGRHRGIIHYTIGQRKGLNISLGRPAFVLEIRPETNEIVLGENEELFTRTVKASKVNFMAIDDLDGEVECFGKIRYNHKGAVCRVKKTGDDFIECTFQEPVRAVTPGQALVLYKEDYVLGGGIIV
ncbi:MAG: tRNA 2-thiouridine(34) synthase MnmA [Clostridia bacterium]|nr:tRNA 2-thiouridine(34) synthase MnmA [Clostridia bacterium]NCC43998.1 tRNA 2-thiouridine(34) synthase MnmA [Clostridia bacterium]